jgi:hypothetical protein
VGILSDVKKTLGYPTATTDFDQDFIIHINSILSVLCQLGVGPVEGMVIADDTTTWASLFTDDRLSLVKTYIYLRVRRLFDPPTTSFLLEAYANQIQEFEWRITAVNDAITAEIVEEVV